MDELLFVDASLSKFIDDKKSWLTWMEVHDLIYHEFSFRANTLGRPPTTSLIFHPLTPQTLVLVAAAIHCMLSECATEKKGTVLFSEDEYQGKFCPSTVMDCITAEATALINFTWWAATYPPPPTCFSSVIICTAQSPTALLSLDWRFNILFGAPYCMSVDTQPLERAYRNPFLHLIQQHLYFIPDSLSLCLSAILSIDGLLRWIGAPWSGFAPPNFILHSSITIITPLADPALPIRHSQFPAGAPHFPANS
jgi:hypothetical protein